MSEPAPPSASAAACDHEAAASSAAVVAPVAVAPVSTGRTPVFPAPLLQPLLDMGFPLAHAQRGLHATSARSVEDAMSWIIEHASDADIDQPLIISEPADPSSAPAAAAAASSAAVPASSSALQFSSFPSSTPFKLVLLVRADLKMRTGKIAAQVAHAAVGTVMELQAEAARERNSGAAGGSASNGSVALRRWLSQGQAKVVLSIKDEAEMHAIEAAAQAQAIPTYIVADAGRTQVAAGSETVLAVGPAPVVVVDHVCGHLKLL